jgi:thiamine-phosphate pyrophosphorylase
MFGAGARPRLIAITDRSKASEPVTLERFERVAYAAQPGSVVLQLRDRELPARERLAFGRALRALARRAGQLFQVNDRLDLARLLAADGLHLGEESVSTADARRLLGEDAFVTRACHELAGVARDDADGVVLSPLLAPRKGRAALGLAALGRARALLSARAEERLLFALGGVDADTAGACLAAGADGVAVIGAVLTSREPERIVEALGCARS